jgi:hypothetical protein
MLAQTFRRFPEVGEFKGDGEETQLQVVTQFDYGSGIFAPAWAGPRCPCHKIGTKLSHYITSGAIVRISWYKVAVGEARMTAFGHQDVKASL